MCVRWSEGAKSLICSRGCESQQPVNRDESVRPLRWRYTHRGLCLLFSRLRKGFANPGGQRCCCHVLAEDILVEHLREKSSLEESARAVCKGYSPAS